MPSPPKIPRPILVVDDEPAFRELLGQFLEQAGYAVVLAADGVAGGRCLARGPFDLVLTDLIMPEMDGIEFITQVRREHPATRIIAMSGGGQISGREYLKLARGLGAHEILEKPFPQEKLLATVADILAAGPVARA